MEPPVLIPQPGVYRGEKFHDALSWDSSATARYMAEYHVRKDNTVQYRGNYYSVPSGTYRSGKTQSGCKKLKGVWNCTAKIRESSWADILLTWEEGSSYMMKTTGEPEIPVHRKLAERILIYVSYNKEVALWLENLRRRKERYYRSNLEVILRSIPSYDGHTLVEAIRMCLDRGYL